MVFLKIIFILRQKRLFLEVLQCGKFPRKKALNLFCLHSIFDEAFYHFPDLF